MTLFVEAGLVRLTEVENGTRMERGISSPSLRSDEKPLKHWEKLGWETGIEPATFGATDRRSTS